MKKASKQIHLTEHKVNSFYAVFRLFNRYYLKSFFGLFFAFFFPSLIYAILGAVIDYKVMLPGIISMTAMAVGLIGMPFSILELKRSVLLKRMGASPVKPWVFTVTMIFYFTIIIILAIFWLMLWALIITRDKSIFMPMNTTVGFLGFWYGNVLNIIMSLTLGFAIASFSKSEMQAQAIGMIVMFPSNFLAGQFISPEVIAQKEVLQWISRFIPFRYTTMIISESWYGDNAVGGLLATLPGVEKQYGNPFLIHEYHTFRLPDLNKLFKNGDMNKYLDGKSTVLELLGKEFKMPRLWDKPDHICGFIIPYVTIAACALISIKKFKWSSAR